MKRSTKQFDCGWYALVLWIRIPSWLAILLQNVEVNSGPLSDDMSFGTQKRAIQCLMIGLAHSEVDVLVIGTASGQRVVLSMMVRRYVKPSEGGGKPTEWI